MDARTAEPEIGEIEIAVWATADADEALATAGALEHGVRHSVSPDPLRRVGADLDEAGTGMSSSVAALFAGGGSVDRTGGVQQFGAAGVGAVADRLKGRGRSVTHGVLRSQRGFVFDKSHKNLCQQGESGGSP